VELYQTKNIFLFYEARDFEPAWLKDGQLAFDPILEAIASIQDHGLDADDYHFNVLKEMAGRAQQGILSEVEKRNAEIIISDAFLKITQHLQGGKVDPSSVDKDWKIRRKGKATDLVTMLNQELHSGLSPMAIIEGLSPKRSEYFHLVNALKAYKPLRPDSDFRIIQIDNLPIRPDSSHTAIPELRTRLTLLGYLEPYQVEAMESFDSVLQKAIMKFQYLHGLNPDALIGKKTLEHLNTPLEVRNEMIKANLERLRWLPDEQAMKRVLVNVADQRMYLLEGQDTLFNTRAIIGRTSRKTPSFQAEMNHLVFAPTWTVPPTILYNDVIPAVRKDLGYLASKNMQVLTMNGQVVDPSSIDWKSVRRNFPYMIRQSPGPDNALGLVKFMFPNPYNVYLHDTPGKSLFAKDERTLSSGCIRIENPSRLALLLLQGQGWNEEKIQLAMNSRKEQTVNLQVPIPTTIVYLTAWANNSGVIHFRSDIYNKDAALIKALRQNTEK
jgi:murein L,D-transpeptidase YcbB/YkuD